MSRALFFRSRRRRRSRSSRSLPKRWNKTVPSPSGFGWEPATRSGIILFCDSATLDECSRVLVRPSSRVLALTWLLYLYCFTFCVFVRVWKRPCVWLICQLQMASFTLFQWYRFSSFSFLTDPNEWKSVGY